MAIDGEDFLIWFVRCSKSCPRARNNQIRYFYSFLFGYHCSESCLSFVLTRSITTVIIGSLVANGVMKKETTKLWYFIRYWLLYCISSRVGLLDVCVVKALKLPFYFKLRKTVLEGKEIFKSSRWFILMANCLIEYCEREELWVRRVRLLYLTVGSFPVKKSSRNNLKMQFRRYDWLK